MSKASVTMNPTDISEKWGRRTKNAVSDIQAAIGRVSESPMEKAASKQDKMLTNLQASVTSGKWARGLKAVSLEEWKTKTAKKVGERLPGGIDAAMDKRRQFDTYLVGQLNTVLPAIQKMPDLTMEDSLQRVRALMEHMHKNPYKK